MNQSTMSPCFPLCIIIFYTKFSLSVVETDLVPAIKGGTSRIVGSSDEVYADASSTQDPDRASGLNLNTAVFRWVTNATSTCFKNHDGSSAMTSSWSKRNVVIKATASSGCLQARQTYSLRMDVKRHLGDVEFFSFKQKVSEINCFINENY